MDDVDGRILLFLNRVIIVDTTDGKPKVNTTIVSVNEVDDVDGSKGR